MCKTIKKWLIERLIVGLALGTALSIFAFIGQTAQASTLISSDQSLTITNTSVSPDGFDPNVAETTAINYCLTAPASVNVGIYMPSGTSSQKVAILTPNVAQNAGCYSVIWDGKNGASTEVGTPGEIVDNGKYFYYIEAKNAYSKTTSTDWVAVGDGPSYGTVKFIDVQVKNPIFDPSDSQKASISFTISKSGYVTLQINDSDNLKVVKVIDNQWYEKGEYTAYWNGEDDVGQKVAQGEYSYAIKLVNGEAVAKETGKLVIKKGYNSQTTQTEDPRIENFYATKEEFDPGRKEKEYIVFNLTAKADLQVAIYDRDDNLVKKLFSKPDQEAKTYQIQWDGGEVIGKDATYTYRIYAKNTVGEDTQKGKIAVAEDRSDTSRANVFKDYVDSLIYTTKDGDQAINFTLEKDATVTVEIRDEKHLVATIAKETTLAEGNQTIYWDGKDKYGQAADDGQYMYRITAKNNAGKEVEEGNFTVKKSDITNPITGECSQFKDVDSYNQYCKAIQWASAQGIFQGYNDGTFKPNQAINRAEALKVILKALKIQLISPGSTGLGFKDTNATLWYGTYVKTGVALGIIHGYQDGTFKPNQIVTHSEGQIMLFRTANSKGVYYPESNDYYPTAPMTRAEMADMLYKYYQNSYELN
ncbi:MAG: S-layer homology domain-containing protein [Candidatus Peregrinibacteria bacterium]|nr:S-layer homology domain-containing protein [Candidatus Peregrinibacteria bacterium]